MESEIIKITLSKDNKEHVEILDRIIFLKFIRKQAEEMNY